jgi:hypothetical protein
LKDNTMQITDADLARWSEPMPLSETRPALNALIAEVRKLRAAAEEKPKTTRRTNVTPKGVVK